MASNQLTDQPSNRSTPRERKRTWHFASLFCGKRKYRLIQRKKNHKPVAYQNKKSSLSLSLPICATSLFSMPENFRPVQCSSVQFIGAPLFIFSFINVSVNVSVCIFSSSHLTTVDQSVMLFENLNIIGLKIERNVLHKFPFFGQTNFHRQAFSSSKNSEKDKLRSISLIKNR